VVAADVDGGGVRTLVDDPVAKLPTVSPGRDMVSFMRPESGLQVAYLARSDGSQQRPLLDEASSARCPSASRPAWSPDGDRLAIVCLSAGGDSTGLWTLDLGDFSASLRTELVPSDRLDGAPTWGGDGRIYYGVKAAGDGDAQVTELWSVAADGSGGPERLPLDPAYSYTHPDWSESGLLYLRKPHGDGDRGDVVVRTGDGQSLETAAGDVGSPTWGADPPQAAALGPSSADPELMALVTFDADDPTAGVREVPLQGSAGIPAWGSR
jgi:Tol biopolymer transport system component